MLVDPKQVHHRVVLMHKDIGTVGNFQDILGSKVGGIELAKGLSPLHGLLVRLSCLVQDVGGIDGGIGDGCEGVAVASIHHLILGEAVDGDSEGHAKGVVALQQGGLGDGYVAKRVGGRSKVSVEERGTAATSVCSSSTRGCIVVV